MTKNKIKQMQRSLDVLGYKITVDGVYGKGTRKVLKKFQKKRGLAVDGLYGHQTAAKLRISVKYKVIETVVKQCRLAGLNKAQTAYILATVKHETAGTWLPLEEYGSKNYFLKRYDPILGSSAKRRNTARKMGNVRRGDGYKYRGRGLPQLTWKKNYKKMSKYLSELYNAKIDLVKYPDLAMNLEFSVAILVHGMVEGVFTGRKLGTYVNRHKQDYRGARRTVNGLDKAKRIAGYVKGLMKYA